ncbi:MAG TPA: hypothetical protein VF952_16720 [Chloroflexia bacterium]
MNTEQNTELAGNPGDGQTSADVQRSSDRAKPRTSRRDFAIVGFVAVIPILCNILALQRVVPTAVGLWQLDAALFLFASLLINPATAALGMLVAVGFVHNGPKRLARLGSLLALVAIVPLFMWLIWQYKILWPLYLGSGITLAAAALIIGSSILALRNSLKS